MIEYIVAGNIDGRSLRKAVAILGAGGLVAFPTDTSWSVGCSISSKEGIARLKRLSGKDALSPLTVLCSDIAQISALCELPTSSFREIKRLVPGPYVFVLPSTNRAARDFDLRRGELGVRIPANPVPVALVDALGEPLLTVTAKRNMLGMDPAEADFPEELLFTAGWEVEELKGVELVLDAGDELERGFSTVLDLRSGDVEVLRAGAGPYP
ncbi:MAG: Sua5/YciO/YrdC/YwlC family protein [Spirochaetales bacterium]|nr:Sua5/YciO/YrdC/YwlC family protein [Spirochaetales bacterium]